MILFPAADFLQVAFELRGGEIMMGGHGEAAFVSNPDEPMHATHVAETSTRLDRLEKALGDLPVPLTRMMMGEIRHGLTQSWFTYVALREKLEAMRDRTRDELSLTTCFVLKQDSGSHFDDTKPAWGTEVDSAFPSAVYDIREAGKCLGLRRYTACVTHLMRTLEVPLAAMGKVFGITTDHTNWQNVLDQIESKVKGMNEPGFGPNWRDDQKFYSGGTTHFYSVKNAWRNHAMHAREKYVEDEADIIYRSVRVFTQRMATRLKE